MTTREVNIHSLHITLPRTDEHGAGLPPSQRAAEALARSAAKELYDALQGNGAGGNDTAAVAIPELRVRLQRGHTSGTEVAHAIAEALRKIREER